MGTAVGFDLLGPLCADAGWDSDPTGYAQASVAPSTLREVPEEHGEESLEFGDWDPAEMYDDFGDWKNDYADAVCVSRWREL